MNVETVSIILQGGACDSMNSDPEGRSVAARRIIAAILAARLDENDGPLRRAIHVGIGTRRGGIYRHDNTPWRKIALRMPEEMITDLEIACARYDTRICEVVRGALYDVYSITPAADRQADRRAARLRENR